MTILHVSDLHGYFPNLPSGSDVIVSSGDFYKHHQRKPNYGPERRKEEIEFQKDWLKYKLKDFKKWLDGRPFLWCSGNHDFFNPCELLNANGIEAIDLDEKAVEYKGLVWYGFPWVRYITGEWNWEAEPKKWKEETQNIISNLKNNNCLDKLDILVAHSPPMGIVDAIKYEGRVGNPNMLPIIDYALQKPLQLYLTGHIHEANGWSRRGDTLYSNAATSYRVIIKENNEWKVCNL